MGRGVLGTVTEITPDHFTVKTENGDLFTVDYSVNTRIMKGSGQRRAQGGNSGDNRAFRQPADSPSRLPTSKSATPLEPSAKSMPTRNLSALSSSCKSIPTR